MRVWVKPASFHLTLMVATPEPTPVGEVADKIIIITSKEVRQQKSISSVLADEQRFLLELQHQKKHSFVYLINHFCLFLPLIYDLFIPCIVLVYLLLSFISAKYEL